MDEKGFMTGQIGKEQRIVPLAHIKNGQTPYARVDGSREWVTLIASICADGSALTPCLIYKGANGQVDTSWVSDAEPLEDKYFVAASDKGWTNNHIAMQWLDLFHKETLPKLADSRTRRLLIVDGHSSHINYAFIIKCNVHRILLCVLPPHSTHRLQPLDVGLFCPLATAYTREHTKHAVCWEGKIGVTKSYFYRIFKAAWNVSTSPDNIKSSFRKAGI